MSCSIPNTDNTQKPSIEVMPIYVNGVEISESEIAQEVQHHPAEKLEFAFEQAKQALVVQQLLIQKARSLNIEEDNEELIVAKLLEQEVDTPEASEEECLRYYEANQSNFVSSPLVEANHILLAVPADDISGRDEAKKLATSIIEQIKSNPESFNGLVAEYSACPSKATGGSLGQISKGQTVSEFEKVLFAHGPGLIDRPVETRYGFHVVIINQKIEGQPLGFEQVETKIKQFLDESTSRRGISQYIEVLVSEAEIEGFEIEVSDTPLMQ